MKLRYEVLICTILFLAICFIYKGQQRVTLNKGQGWDGAHYYPIAEQIQEGATIIEGELPYINRLGTLFLVGTYSRVMGIDLLDSALIINLTGIFVATILLLIWLRIFIDIFWIRALLLLLFMMNWQVPLRWSFYCSMSTDAWGAAFFVGGLLLLHLIRKAYNDNTSIVGYVVAFSLVVAVGNLFRESNVALAFAIFFILNPLKGLNINRSTLTVAHGVGIIRKMREMYLVKQTSILFLPIVSVIAINSIVSHYKIIDPQNGYSYIRAVFTWFYEKSLPEYVLGICIAYGPLILLLPFYFKEFKAFFRERQELFLLLIISLIFGFIGGSDTERITFMSSFPILFVLIGMAIKYIYDSSQKWWLYVLLILQTIALRFYWALPDYPSDASNTPVPFFTLFGEHFPYLFLYSHHGHLIINSLLFLEYFILFITTFYILYNKIQNPFKQSK